MELPAQFFFVFEGCEQTGCSAVWRRDRSLRAFLKAAAMERRMRGTKREINAAKAGMSATDDTRLKAAFRDDYDRAFMKLTRQTAEYQNFCTESGFKRQ